MRSKMNNNSSSLQTCILGPGSTFELSTFSNTRRRAGSLGLAAWDHMHMLPIGSRKCKEESIGCAYLNLRSTLGDLARLA